MTSNMNERHMQRAFELARHQHGRTGSNPAVGCVITDADGRVISEAATGDGGRPHAEEIALARIGSEITLGGTAYVTLEPCRERTHGGQSCSERLIAAGIQRLVCALADRHPQGAGGFERLRKAGLIVETGLMADAAEALYRTFFQSIGDSA